MAGSAPDVDRGLSNRELAAAITELAGHLNAATRRWLALIAEFDRRKGWSDSVTQSCAHWLNWQCGLALGAAREKVRVAHALEELPLIGAAMGRGELSYWKVREVTRVATQATEQCWLDIALHGTASHVEQLVRKYRRVQQVEALSRAERQQARRSVSYYFDDDDGSLVLKARLPAEAGMLLLKALEGAKSDLPLPPKDCEPNLDVPAGTSGTLQRSRAPTIPPTAQRADALALVAESFLKHGAEALNGGERHQIVIHVDEETLRERAAGSQRVRTRPLDAVETARRLACDCSYVKITEDEKGEPLDVGRKTRSPSRLRFVERSTHATKAAFFQAARTSATWTDTTCITGPRAARPN